jgi:hypothetical protein
MTRSRIDDMAARYCAAADLITRLFRAERRLLGQPPVRPDFAPRLEAFGRPAGEAAAGASETGNYFASAVIVPVPRETARRLLPRRLEPAPQILTPAGQHPLLLLFGYQWDVRPPWQPKPGMDYLEAIAAVPYIRWSTTARRAGPFAHMPRLHLDKLLPTVLGWVCGYAKRLGRFYLKGEEYEVRSYFEGAVLIRGRFTPQGAPGPVAGFPLFPPVRPIFEQTLVGKTASGLYPCTRMIFDLDHALLQPVRAAVTIDPRFLPGLAGMTYTVDGIDTQPLGAFQVHTRWDLFGPFGCPR